MNRWALTAAPGPQDALHREYLSEQGTDKELAQQVTPVATSRLFKQP